MLNLLPAVEAESAFLRCCGSRAWAAAMTARRPFREAADVGDAADAIWARLEPSDWMEAFAAHPKIGETGGAPGASAESSREQAGMASASDAVRRRMSDGNREYDARFGFTYIVCATGKSADEMLALLEERLTHSREDEIRIAAEEQRRITRLRLARMLEDTPSAG
jgi:OHCU decarboxylase